ncbi:glycosyltransferase [Chloroflexota bacterium]
MTKSGKSAEVIKPSVLYFGPRGLQGGIGGSARVRNMLDVLRKLQANTELISYLPEKKFRITRQQINDYLNTTTISVPASSSKIIKASALLQILRYGLKYIKKADILFAHSPGIVYGFPALLLAKTFHKPLLIDLTDSKDHDTPKFIYNSVLKNSKVVFTVSRYLVEVAKRAGCRNVVHTPGFIDGDAFKSNVAARERVRKELGIGSGEVVIGYSGAFSAIEGLSYLIRAFKNLSDQYEGTKLVLLGGRNVAGSEDIPQLINELCLSERVILVPPQPYELVPEYLSAFDIACSPKVDCEENRAADPIRVYEYMSVGLPTIASAMGETANVIENGRDGFLVKPGDEDDLARVLGYVIQNLDSLQELKRRAREKVIKGYSQQAVIGTIRRVFDELSVI